MGKHLRLFGWSALVLPALLVAGCAGAPDAPVSASPSAASAASSHQPDSPQSNAAATNSAESVSAPKAEQMMSCHQLAGQLSVPEQVGQLFMVGVQVGTAPEEMFGQLEAQHIGSVILLGQRSGLTAVQAETSRYQQNFPELLIAADQEGGLVQRLAGSGFETIPSAVEQGKLPDEQLRSNWQRYAREMRNAAVRYDLAPVADVVPADQVSNNAPVGQLERAFSSDSGVVADKVTAVVQGLSDGRVASSVKHFPGLGRVPENTDFAVGHDRVSQLTEEELRPFQAAIDAGVSSVMISSAIYDLVDPGVPGVFSAVIIEDILRGRMGYQGLVISDDLGAAVAVAAFSADQRALRFFAAGGDLLISADPGLTAQMVSATRAKAAADPQFAASVTEKAGRVLKLKSSVGLVSCS